jgi:hypothetical protein
VEAMTSCLILCTLPHVRNGNGYGCFSEDDDYVPNQALQATAAAADSA